MRRKDLDTETQARTRLMSLLTSPDAVARQLSSLCSRESVARVRPMLLRLLETGSVGAALDAVGRSLARGDEGLVVGFWARGEARAAGVPVPFDARGLERLGPVG